MHWPVLILSGVLEAVWAIALGLSDGFTVLWPTVIFLIAGVLSMVGLAYAMRGIPVGTAYAVWTGLGAALTVALSTLFGGESASVLKLLFLAGIVGCVIGLKLVHSREEHVAEANGDLPIPDGPPGT
jgi:quaternary ammonium compound-resistance protein SugE